MHYGPASGLPISNRLTQCRCSIAIDSIAVRHSPLFLILHTLDYGTMYMDRLVEHLNEYSRVARPPFPVFGHTQNKNGEKQREAMNESSISLIVSDFSTVAI